jgi:hypothetical protein
MGEEQVSSQCQPDLWGIAGPDERESAPESPATARCSPARRRDPAGSRFWNLQKSPSRHVSIQCWLGKCTEVAWHGQSGVIGASCSASEGVHALVGVGGVPSLSTSSKERVSVDGMAYQDCGGRLSNHGVKSKPGAAHARDCQVARCDAEF